MVLGDVSVLERKTDRRLSAGQRRGKGREYRQALREEYE
jgi:hypothetical protein